MSSVTTNPVVAEGSVGADASQLAESGAQIAAGVASSNPVGVAIGSVTALNALAGLVQNLQVLQNSKALTPAQVDQIFTVLNMQTVQADKAWQKATGSAPV